MMLDLGAWVSILSRRSNPIHPKANRSNLAHNLSDVQWRMIESMMIYVWGTMRYKTSWPTKN